MHPKVTARSSRVVARAVEALDPSMGDGAENRAYSQRAMPSFKRHVIGCWVLSLCALFTAVPAVAKHAPDPTFKTLDGGTRKLSSLRGQIVVVNFWATWCAPCQEELPRLSKWRRIMRTSRSASSSSPSMSPRTVPGSPPSCPPSRFPRHLGRRRCGHDGSLRAGSDCSRNRGAG